MDDIVDNTSSVSAALPAVPCTMPTSRGRKPSRPRGDIMMMFMPARVNRRDQPRAQNDQHDGDAKFEPVGKPLRDRNLQANNQQTHNRQRDRVSQAPEQPDRCRRGASCRSLPRKVVTATM